MGCSKLATAVFSLALALPLDSALEGCSCTPKKPPIESLQVASAVFEGRAERVQSRSLKQLRLLAWYGAARVRAVFGGPDPSNLPEPEHLMEIEIRFKVIRKFKGDLGSTAIVLTGLGDGDCGYPFKGGHDYLVYAREYDGQLHTGICSRTANANGARTETELLSEHAGRQRRFSAALSELRSARHFRRARMGTQRRLVIIRIPKHARRSKSEAAAAGDRAGISRLSGRSANTRRPGSGAKGAVAMMRSPSTAIE